MAHLEPMGLDALGKIAEGLADLGANIDEVAQTCINKADPTMEAAYKGALAGSVPKAAHMVATTPAKRNALGDYSVSRPVGYDPNSKSKARYAMLAAFAEYGVKPHRIEFKKGKNKFGKEYFDHPGLPANPFHSAAVSAAYAPTKAVVDKTFAEEVKRLTGT